MESCCSQNVARRLTDVCFFGLLVIDLAKTAMAEDKDLRSLFVGNFEPLTQVVGLSGFKLSQLRQLDEETIVECVKPELRLLMKLFLQQHPWPEKASPFVQPTMGVVYSPSSQTLSLQDQVISCRFDSVRYPDGIGVGTLPKFFAHMPLHQIRRVDLSRNDLFDEDMEPVAEFIQLLPNCEHVLLRLNRFHGVIEKTGQIMDQALEKMLAQPSMQYVDVTHNPLASTDRQDFFRQLPVESLTKLIWIPRQWLASNAWHILLEGRDDVKETVGCTHEAYYALASNQLLD